MVDQKARRKYGELLRQFISGRMTEDEYMESFFSLRVNKKDSAFLEIFNEVDAFCEDAHPKKMTQQWRLNNDQRRLAAQSVLFLQTDQEYEWCKPLWDGSVFLITVFVVFLMFALLQETPLLVRFATSVPLVAAWQWYEQWQRKRSIIIGVKEAWPFLRQADLAEAARHPRLLDGNRTRH